MPLLSLVIEKSPLNPVQFVPENKPRRIGIYTVHQGDDWEVNTLLTGQFKVGYKYPAEITDTLPLQFSYTYIGVAPASSIELQLIKPLRQQDKRTGLVFHTWNYSSIVALTNNTTVIDGVTFPLGTLEFTANLAAVPNLVPGTYYLRLKVPYSHLNDGVFDRTHYEISEPIDIRKEHRGTVLLSGTNNTNDFDTVFVQFAKVARMRVRGALWGQNLDSEDVTFTNQSGVRKKLYGRPGEAESLTIGGGQGVPKWVRSAANYFMDLDSKYVDERLVTKDDGAKWESIQTSNAYPLSGITMSVRLGDPTDRYKTIVRPHITLLSGLVRPYYVSRVSMVSALAVTKTLGTGFYVSDNKSEADMLYSLNKYLVANSLTGIVDLVRGELRYHMGPGEEYTPSTSVVLTKYLEYTSKTDTSAPMTAIVEATYASIVFEGGTSTQVGTGTLTSGFATYTYPVGAGNKVTRIFHNNTIARINLFGSNVTGYTGTVPIGLIEWALHDTALTSFDFAALLPAVATLESVDLSDNQITTLTNLPVLYNPAGPDFVALWIISLRNNLLSVASINTLIKAVYDMVNLRTGVTNGDLNTSQQTPAAIPSGIGATAKSDLQGAPFNWTVTTDT